MKKYIISIVSTVLCLMSAYADNITVADVSMSPGETQSVSINLTNTETNLVSFQMDLTLPEGITVNKSGCSLSNRFTDPDQELTIGRQPNGAIRLTSTSFNLTPISGTSGGIITLSLTASVDSEGGTATINNIRFVTSNSERITLADATFDISIASASPVITFADPAVKALCVANWDTSGDGELSEAEAAAVTDLGEVFRGNTTITSFNELQYFTGLMTIGNNAFDGCTSLTSIAIPTSLNRVKTEAFKNCTSLSKVIVSDIAAWCGIIYDVTEPWEPLGNFPLGLALHLYSDENTEITEVVIPEGVTRIEPMAFRDAKFVTSVTIPNSVTYIGTQAFCGMHRLTSITIPQNVTTIEAFTFDDCQSLTSLTIPEGVVNLEGNVFRDCTSLTSVSLPESLKVLGGHTFLGCRSLASITIPDGITDLSMGAFEDCPNLTTFIYNKAENALTKINGVYQIGTAEDLRNFAILSTAANTDICAQLTADIDYTGYSFTGHGLSEHFQHIGLNGYCGTFDGNGHTITVNINNPYSWEVAALFRTIGRGGVVKNLRVAGHVESVSKFSAGIVSNLKSSKVSHCVSDVDIISHIDGDCTDGGIAGIATYDGQESVVEYCVVAGSFQGSNAHHRGGIIGIGYGGNSDNITIDNCLFLANVDGLDVTESGTFIRQPTNKTTINNCYYLNVLGTVTSGTQTTTDQLTSGELCFLLNGNQSNIDWTQNLTGTDVDTYPLPFSTHAQVYAYGNTYSNNDLSPIITFADPAVKALCVANWDTNGDGELSEAEAAAVTDLGEVFKDNTTITSFNELQYFTGLTSIGDYALCSCHNLVSVTIPDNVTSIGRGAFWATGLTSITIPNSVTSIGQDAFNDCQGLTTLTIPGSVAEIGPAAFYACRNLASVVFEEGVTIIGDNAFHYCNSLASISIPNSVTRIGLCAFADCSITSLTLPNSVTSIGGYAFSGCNNLTSVTMPASVITFNGTYAFGGGTNHIESVYITDLAAWLGIDFGSNNPLRSGAKLYLNNEEVKDLVIPDGTTAILGAAFEGCESLTSVTIPNSVTSIAGWAFNGCSNMTTVTIPNSVTTIDSNAFMSCSSLTDVWCYAEAIPSTGNDLFLSTDIASATLHVPAASLEAYSNTAPWSGFGTIVAIDEVTSGDELYASDITRPNGCKVNIPIILENLNDYAGLQCQITLPEGVSFEKVNRTGRLTDHKLSTDHLGNNTYRVLIYTDSRTHFTGNDGALFTMTVNIADDMEDGSYPIAITNIVASDADLNESFLSNSAGILTIDSTIKLGDATNDGRVNVTDILAVANYILEIPMATFNEQAADVNGDGRVNVTDLLGIVNIILPGNSNNGNSAPEMLMNEPQ